MTALILASSSPRRRALLARFGLPFTVQPAAVDETLLPAESPAAAVRRLAALKADTLAALYPTATILAADTLVVDTADDTIFAKPPTPAVATAMLRRLRGRQHAVITGVALRSPRHAADQQMTTLVQMHDYSDAEIAAYVASGDPLDKAGGYAIQHVGFRPVAHIAGCYTNVVGLPLCLAHQMLTAAGFQPDPAAFAACNAYANQCPLALFFAPNLGVIVFITPACTSPL